MTGITILETILDVMRPTVARWDWDNLSVHSVPDVMSGEDALYLSAYDIVGEQRVLRIPFRMSAWWSTRSQSEIVDAIASAIELQVRLLPAQLAPMA